MNLIWICFWDTVTILQANQVMKRDNPCCDLL